MGKPWAQPNPCTPSVCVTSTQAKLVLRRQGKITNKDSVCPQSRRPCCVPSCPSPGRQAPGRPQRSAIRKTQDSRSRNPQCHRRWAWARLSRALGHHCLPHAWPADLPGQVGGSPELKLITTPCRTLGAFFPIPDHCRCCGLQEKKAKIDGQMSRSKGFHKQEENTVLGCLRRSI